MNFWPAFLAGLSTSFGFALVAAVVIQGPLPGFVLVAGTAVAYGVFLVCYDPAPDPVDRVDDDADDWPRAGNRGGG